MREALLQAVLDAPEDDAPRLVYADWLAEQGEAEHAELIRTQITAARHPEDEALATRAAQLLQSCGERVAGDLAQVSYPRPPGSFRRGQVRPRFEIRRGFVERVVFSPLFLLLSRGELWRMLAQHPVQKLEIGVLAAGEGEQAMAALTACMGQLAGLPLVEHLEELGFFRVQSTEWVGPDPLEVLLQARWRSLRKLTLSVWFGDDHANGDWNQELLLQDLQRLALARPPVLETLVLRAHYDPADLADLAPQIRALPGIEVQAQEDIPDFDL